MVASPDAQTTAKHAATLARRLVAALTARRQWLAVAESCTGGLLAATITDVPGASAVFYGGVVSYANAAKVGWLGVDARLLAARGAVSAEVATAMTEGLLAVPVVSLACAITGIAGPSGGTAGKPVGTVFIAVGDRKAVAAVHHLFPGDRAAVRAGTVVQALRALLDRLDGSRTAG
ncbi:MAG: nicotinamide-nucleotide amidohydrolase family protein [Nitrospirota bacterium]|jgi:PncC family amidohydrolase